MARYGGSAAATRYYLTDHLGSVLATVDNDGTMRSKTLYRPYGTALNEWVSTNDKHRYTGKERDRELSSQWDYFGARYYIPGVRIFSSVDPQWEKTPGIGSYVYCADNPLKYTDPNGEIVWLAVMAAAAIYIAMTPDVVQAPRFEGDYVKPTAFDKVVQQTTAVATAFGVGALIRQWSLTTESGAVADAAATGPTRGAACEAGTECVS